ncbi:hypothetical protein GSI_01355 [Ganoderma sinense ZZ0214-1]|uniref:Uncharacterized protein n=1 Tax=Ganoderma sinense ZZ0214-1 TaxID=1077348 RepID=A0A2G8SV71_9APHY|nr:hypothetical protein GSI_01355 [Ganoderma sinense ZZ0214-1]
MSGRSEQGVRVQQGRALLQRQEMHVRSVTAARASRLATSNPNPWSPSLGVDIDTEGFSIVLQLAVLAVSMVYCCRSAFVTPGGRRGAAWCCAGVYLIQHVSGEDAHGFSRATLYVHGKILLAYLPTSKLEHITNKAARCRTLANLFHACLRRALAPLASAGVDGIKLVRGDGVKHRGHPILAVYVGDYPEQLLVTGCKNSECPKCSVPHADLGAETDTSRALRDLGKVLDALATLDDGPRAYTRACHEAGIKPIFHPYWEDLPFANIFLAITPDLLHQLYQGVVKHLIAWLKEAYGMTELDARCRQLPQNYSLRHFSNGISKLSRVTGKEHQDICRILLGLITGLSPQNGVSPARIECSTRALLDFLYYAAYPTHTAGTLKLLDDALWRFHANKAVFVDLGIREHFKLPKLHFLDHYRECIEMFGSTDNYDTQHSERLHIDFAKDAFRTTNGKDELSQMTIWMERKEKIEHHEEYINWHLQQDEAARAMLEALSVTFEELAEHYGASFFRDALKRFVVEHNSAVTLMHAQVERASAAIYFPFSKVLVWHRVKFWISDPYDVTKHIDPIKDTAHIRPARKGKYGVHVPGRFDTVLVNDSSGGVVGIKGYRVAQLFSPAQLAHSPLFSLT